MASSKGFYVVHKLKTFKVKIFLKTYCGSILENESNSQEPPFLQKYFNAACNSIFLYFCAAIMDFAIILKCPVFFLLVTHQEKFPPVQYHLC